MNRKIRIYILTFFFNFLLINNISGEEKDYFLTLKYNKVNVRHGPSERHLVKFVYKKKYLPVKIIDSHDRWRKTIDLKNNSGWIHISQLTKKKSAINIADLALIFKRPNIYSQPLARLEKGTMVMIKRCKNEWCKILVQSNTGWLQKKFLWGKF
tara:strand:+ start:119 stop:580 length:462 start_codon:yes stop_codon:yes gene_type:complete